MKVECSDGLWVRNEPAPGAKWSQNVYIDRKHMKNQLYCLPDCNNYRVVGKYCGCFWGKHFAAEVNIPLEGMEKCIGKNRPFGGASFY